MGVYRCNHCKHIAERIYHRSLPNVVKCKQCQKDVNVYDTVPFISHLIQRYTVAMREIESLKNQLDEIEINENTEPNTPTLSQLNFHDTDEFANEKQHQPLANWFKKQNIQPEFDYSAVNMSGFYDEAADKIVQYYDFFAKILSQIKSTYGRNSLNLNIDLKKYSQKEQQQINNLCREFYSHTLFSVYNYKKQDKNLFLKLQPATPIRQFFTGAWLEWFALNQVLETVQKKQVKFSVARSAKIHFQNQDLHELDVLLYTPNGSPIIIECKTGEYRKDLDKYLNLRKRLNIPAQNFILLVLDIDDAQAKSLSGMYDLTFVTLQSLPQHLNKVVA